MRLNLNIENSGKFLWNGEYISPLEKQQTALGQLLQEAGKVTTLKFLNIEKVEQKKEQD